MKKRTRFYELKNVFIRLLGPHGCAWDRAQTHRTLLKYLREETEEFIDAVKSGNQHHMQEELGDILLHVMFHAQLAAQEERFDVEDVIAGLIRKLKRRHPHVFGQVKLSTSKQVVAQWHRIKAQEKRSTAKKNLKKT